MNQCLICDGEAKASLVTRTVYGLSKVPLCEKKGKCEQKIKSQLKASRSLVTA